MSIAELRESLVRYLYCIFKIYHLNINATKLHSFSVNFENEMYSQLSLYEYIKKINELESILNIQDGYFPSDKLGIKYLLNKKSVKDILYFTISENNPRNVIIKMFVTLLINSHSKYKNNNELALSIAKTIEKTCYNNIITISKCSENPPCRQWSSQIFLQMYSNRCGIIYNLLNPNSESCKIYGSSLLQQLVNESIDIGMIGNMTEAELCPQSIQKEKEEISLRLGQRVVEKESNLFRCPKCKERRVTYREVQLRAIDEAPDYLCYCLNCKHRFKGH